MKFSKQNLNKKDNQTGSVSLLPLVPPALLIPLWLISLALPNLVYSGVSFADTLHIMKWTVAGVPVAIALIVAGLRLLWYGSDRFNFSFDIFGSVWMLMLVYCIAQAFWVNVSSFTGFIHELICFAAVWAFYVITAASYPNSGVRILLWLANINAAINVVFAELQMRGLNDFTSLILPTPGNYIGNTAQQNMFGLWMAICVMSSVYLFIAYAILRSGKKRHPFATAMNLVLMAVNMWGLWNSTSRSAIFSLAVGLAVLGFIVLFRFGKEFIKRFAVVMLLLAALLGGVVLINSQGRGTELIAKSLDMVKETETIGGRIGIWSTSWAMFKEYPMGVGVGQYKWHYLEAQRAKFNAGIDQKWQFTHWAHNEYLQWMCEAGVTGGVMLLLMYLFWAGGFLNALIRRTVLEPEVIWGCAMVALVSFNALWTRPFHRIENLLWLAMAFAVSNRGLLPNFISWRATFSKAFAGLLGGVFVASSVLGLVYLGNGIKGNLELRQALSTGIPAVQRSLLENAASHLMTREEANKHLGYHYLYLGDRTGDIEVMAKGFNLLWQHFLREPHSEELSPLLEWSQRFQQKDILNILASYLKPGTYRLEERDNIEASDGKTVTATVLVPVQNSGGFRFKGLESESVTGEIPESPGSATDETVKLSIDVSADAAK